jgi:hypothetical protein
MATSLIFKKLPKANNHPINEKIGQSGHPGVSKCQYKEIESRPNRGHANQQKTPSSDGVRIGE